MSAPAVVDPVAAVDELVRAAAPGLPTPPNPGGPVLVAGPGRAGVTAVRDALARLLPDREVSESPTEAAPELVVFVVSAAAPLTPSDCAVLDAAAAHTDAVLGVISKIDLHRGWRDILHRDAEILAAHDDRHRGLRWVGTAAAPELGPPRVDELATAVTDVLADPATACRNRLRSWATVLTAVAGDLQRRAERPRARQRDLIARRRELVARTRLARVESDVALRRAVQQTRIRLGARVAGRCAALRAELSVEAAVTPRRMLAGFTDTAADRAAAAFGELDDEISVQLTRLSERLGLPVPPAGGTPDPPVLPAPGRPARHLETRLMWALGGGFGLGLAWTSSRAVAGLAPALTGLGMLFGLLVGLVAGCWVVTARLLLAQRAALDGWLSSAIAELRSGMDRLVAARLLAAEAEWSCATARRRHQRADAVAEELRELDARARECAGEAAETAAESGRALAGIAAALAVVGKELAVVGKELASRDREIGN